MLWRAKWARHAKALGARRAKGLPVPAGYLKRPRIRSVDHEYLEAFDSLHRSRKMGHSSPEPVQVSEILAYVMLRGIVCAGARVKYLRLVQLMDQAYLDHWAEENPPPKA